MVTLDSDTFCYRLDTDEGLKTAFYGLESDAGSWVAKGTSPAFALECNGALLLSSDPAFRATDAALR